ncbi:MAG TPA: CPBP family intramembrane glutamic endopeptidase [Candidatus Limnocylindria bacterium]|nr:CPBP family intramembrane glutamic endopeptidase [Candidatus Limnocylindria bacterium]
MPPPDEPRSLNLAGLRLPLRETTVVLATTFVLLIDWYHPLVLGIGPEMSLGLSHVGLFLIVPLLILLLLGERPNAYGLRLGEWRIGLTAAGVLAALATPAILLVSGQPDFVLYYRHEPADLPGALVGNAVNVAAAEFLFRGFLMWTLIRTVGPLGVVLATFPFVFTHLGKPELETLSTFFGGLGFGWIAWRTRSVLYGALLHAYLISLIVLLASR